MKVLGQFKRFFLFYAQKLSGRAKTFRVAMLPCYPGFSASGLDLPRQQGCSFEEPDGGRLAAVWHQQGWTPASPLLYPRLQPRSTTSRRNIKIAAKVLNITHLAPSRVPGKKAPRAGASEAEDKMHRCFQGEFQSEHGLRLLESIQISLCKCVAQFQVLLPRTAEGRQFRYREYCHQVYLLKKMKKIHKFLCTGSSGVLLSVLASCKYLSPLF